MAEHLKSTKTTKMVVDAAMSVVLLIQMSYQVMGQEAHEWIGAGMLVLFILHNLLNWKWYKSLFKGRYTTMRTVQTAVTLSVLAVMLCLMISGIMMSRHAFAFLNLDTGVSLARLMHLATAYWGFVLMGVHLGLHWGMILGMFRKKRKVRRTATIVIRCIAVLIVVYGVYVFIQNGIPSYMLLQNQFAFFDFEKNAILIFAENLAVMWLWVWIGHYVATLIKWRSVKTHNREMKW